MNKKMLGLRILELREKKGMTMERMAEALGMPYSTYSDLERGKSTLTAERLEQLATFHGVTLDEFMSFDHPVLHMQDYASHGYNVIHTQNQQINTEVVNEKLDRLLDLMGKQIELLSELVRKSA